MQLLPHIVDGLVDDELTELACISCHLEMAMYTRLHTDQYSEDDLAYIDRLILDQDQLLKQLFHTINFNTPKYHKLSHFTADVRLLGHPREYNSDWYEHAHYWIKLLYR